MSRRLAYLIFLGLLTGCQTTQTPAPVPPAALSAPATAATTPADPHVRDVNRLVEAQAKAIEAVPPAAKSADAKAVAPPAAAKVIESGKPPVAAATPLPPEPPAVPKPPAVAAVEKAIAESPPADAVRHDDGFKPVPPMTGVITPADVAIIPPPETPAANTPAAGTPPASPPTATTPPAVTPNAAPPASPAAVANSSVPTVTPNAAPPAAAAPEPVKAAASPDKLADQLAQNARLHSRDLGPQFDQQLYLMLRGEKTPTAESLADLSGEDRDVLGSLLDGLTLFRSNVNADNNLLLPKKIKPITDMADRLRSRADLNIVNAHVCRTIRGFGMYDPIEPLRLPAGLALRPKLYFEIENITPRLDANNLYATVLRIDFVLYDEGGGVKWTLPNVAVTDLCRNRRRDFFLQSTLTTFPQNLVPGNYTLKITVTDEVARRVSESGLPMTITPATNVPAANPVGPPPPG